MDMPSNAQVFQGTANLDRSRKLVRYGQRQAPVDAAKTDTYGPFDPILVN